MSLDDFACREGTTFEGRGRDGDIDGNGGRIGREGTLTEVFDFFTCKLC